MSCCACISHLLSGSGSITNNSGNAVPPVVSRPAEREAPKAITVDETVDADPEVRQETSAFPMPPTPMPVSDLAQSKALSVRLSQAAKYNRRKFITLCEVRGSTGSDHEGFLQDASEAPQCCSPLRFDDYFYVVKGPWLFKFKSSDTSAKSVGVPTPLDGAEVTPTELQGFDFTNTHVKEDFYGKSALQGIDGYSAVATFTHKINLAFVAPSVASRDEWVRILSDQISKLAKHTSNTKDHPGIRRAGTRDTIYRVNNMAGALFSQWEEDLERQVLTAAQENCKGFVE